MAQRCLVSVGVLTALTVVVLLATIPVAGQTPSAPPAQPGKAATTEKRKVEDKDHDGKAGEDKDKDDKKDGKKDHKKKHDHKPKKS